MTEPAQYISGRTVQEQMNELISYVDTRAAEVASDEAQQVLQPAEDAKDAAIQAKEDAQAAQAAAEQAVTDAAAVLTNAVKKTGEASQNIAGDITVAGNLSTSADLSAGGDLGVTGDAGVQGQLSALGGCDLRAPVKIPVTPTNNNDAASKKYVDDSLAGYVPMVRTTGNQDIAGTKTFANLAKSSTLPLESVPYKHTNNSSWKMIYSWSSSTVNRSVTLLIHSRNDNRAVIITAGGNQTNGNIHNAGSYTGYDNKLKLAYNVETGNIELYTSLIRINIIALCSGISNNENTLTLNVGDGTEVAEPVVSDTFAWVVGVTS